MKEINTWEELVARERELAGFEDEDEDLEDEVAYLEARFFYDEIADLEPLER